MTFIAKPVIEDSHVLNHIARDLLVPTDDPNVTNLRRGFKILTEDGVVHDVTFSQLDGLINILDLHRPVADITPLQYLIQAYDIKDLVLMGQDGWAVSEYSIEVLHVPKTVRFDGTLIRGDEPEKVFAFALGEFDFIQQFSLSRVIAAQNEQLESVAGTFDFSYSYHWGPTGTRVKPLDVKATPV